MPMPGNSSPIASLLSPNRSSTVSTRPPGRVIRLSSAAPSTEPYQAAAAAAPRAPFYFYSDSRQAVLGELVRRAVARGHAAAAPWLAGPDDPVAALRAGTTAGAQQWQASAPVLRAIVENWRTDPRLTAL